VKKRGRLSMRTPSGRSAKNSNSITHDTAYIIRRGVNRNGYLLHRQT
jgi:hypothetical protein